MNTFADLLSGILGVILFFIWVVMPIIVFCIMESTKKTSKLLEDVNRNITGLRTIQEANHKLLKKLADKSLD